MSSIQPPYGENVVGKHCSVVFEVGKKLVPYTGRIIKFEATIDEEASTSDDAEEAIVRRHYIVFEADGDELWFDLESLKQDGRLKWLSEKRPRSVKGSDDQHRQRSKKTASRGRRGTATNRADDEISSLEDGQDDPSSDYEMTTERVAAAEITPPRKLKKPRTSTSTSSAKKKTNTKKQLPLTAEQKRQLQRCDSWIEGMAHWLEHIPHGLGHKTVSPANAKSVMRQVKKLVSGQGVSYTKWPADKIFYENRPIDLQHTDISQMLQEAKEYERLYGEDSGHGWLLQHPIKKLLLFQEHYCEGK